MRLQQSTIRAKNREKIAKSIVILFVVITLAVLAAIVGYVVFKGFVTIKDLPFSVTSIEQESLASPEYPESEYIFIAHGDIRTDVLDGDQLLEMYTKSRQANWGDITMQNLKIWPFMYAQDSRWFDSAAPLALEDDEDSFGDYTSFVETPDEMLTYIANVEGSIGLVPAGLFSEDQLKQVQVLSIRRISLLVNAETFRVFDNQQLREIQADQVEQVFTGELANWESIGGPDLAVTPLAYDDSGVYTAMHQRGIPSGVTIFDDRSAFIDAIESTPGAAGYVLYTDTLDTDAMSLDVVHHIVKQNLDWHYIVEKPARSGAWGGISSIIINTFVLIIFTLLFSSPIGIMAAIYLIEYSTENRFIRLLRLGTETLAGIPSIVFGLFGYIFFVDILQLGIGFISATLTVTLMILPTIIRTSEEALKSVPGRYREGSLALGATRLTTVCKVVLPAASPGILSGVILAVGRVIGETAVLIYTLGSNYELVQGPKSSARVLSLHIYNLFSEAISFERAFSTATVLIFMILLVNFATNKLIGRINNQQRS